MGIINRFDLSSDFTLFFLGMSIFFIVISILLARATKGKPKKSYGQKYDDTIVDRSRELID